MVEVGFVMTNEQEKNPHAVALGRLAKGVPKRFSATKAERSEAARKAVEVRWNRYKEQLTEKV
jgi:hypothetical protein